MYDILELNDKVVSELKEIARLMNIQNYDELRRQELIYKILDQQALNPSSTASIKESLSGKNFGSDKVQVAMPEVVESATPAASSDGKGPSRRKRISPPRKEAPPAEAKAETEAPQIPFKEEKPAPVPTFRRSFQDEVPPAPK